MSHHLSTKQGNKGGSGWGLGGGGGRVECDVFVMIASTLLKNLYPLVIYDL